VLKEINLDTSVIVGAVGVIATLFAPVIGVAAARWYKNKELNAVPDDRKASLEGHWVGKGIQEVGPEGSGPLETKVSATVRVSRKEIIGEFNWSYEIESRKVSLSMKMNGGFLYDRYGQLNYNNQIKVS
jgi:hypothetical protein